MEALCERWLVHLGLDAGRARGIAAAARERSRAYPRPLPAAREVLIALLERLGPLLALGRPCRASRLDPEAFDDFASWLTTHRSPSVRMAGVLVLEALLEQLDDGPPPVAAGHPLDHRTTTVLGLPAEVDVAVIGSGAGGAPVAWRLARAGLRVAVIEKGGLMRPDVPWRVLRDRFVEQGMVADPRGGAALVLAGTAVGGTTPINSGTCLHPLPERLDRWDERWGTRFSGGELDPWLSEVDGVLRVAPVAPPLQSKSADVVQRGLLASGRPGAHPLPRNAPGCVAEGRCCFGCPGGWKRSVDLAFLPEAVASGALVVPHVCARAILERDGHVELDLLAPTGPHRLRCRHVVLSAGALATPGLIRRSRLGSTYRLAGGDLAIHPAVKVLAWIPGLGHGPHGVPQGLGFRDPSLPRVSFEGIHTPVSVAGPMLALAGRDLGWWLERHDDVASFGLMLRERTRGRVREARGRPLLSYGLDPQDARDIGAGIALLAEVFLAAGAERVLMPLAGRPSQLSSRDELMRFDAAGVTPCQLTVAGFHPQGTAGIGRVVDAELRLPGTRRVSVCDASVLPESPGVNPQVTVMALALRLADRLAAELK